MFLYLHPFLRLIASFIVSVEIYENPEICELDDQEEQNEVDAHIFADTFAEYDYGSKGCEQYPFGQVTPSFPVI